MNRRDRDSQTLPQFQQTPQQADTVCATGKRTAHCLPRQYTVQFPELFQHRTGSASALIAHFRIGEPCELTIPDQLDGAGLAVTVLGDDTL